MFSPLPHDDVNELWCSLTVIDGIIYSFSPRGLKISYAPETLNALEKPRTESVDVTLVPTIIRKG